MNLAITISTCNRSFLRGTCQGRKIVFKSGNIKWAQFENQLGYIDIIWKEDGPRLYITTDLLDNIRLILAESTKEFIQLDYDDDEENHVLFYAPSNDVPNLNQRT